MVTTNSEPGVMPRWLSVEILVTMLVSLSAIAGSWATLNTKAQATEAKVVAVEAEQKEISVDVNEIKMDVGVIKNEQKHIRKQLDAQESDLNYIRALLDRQYAKPSP